MKRSLRTAILLICVFTYALFVWNPAYIQELSRFYEDWRMALTNSRAKNLIYPELLLIAIDDESLSRIPEKYPWNRRLLAQVIENLNQAGAKVIGIEEYFQAPSSMDRQQDLILAASLKKSKNVVCQNHYHAFQTHDGKFKRQISPPIPEVRRNAAGFGYLQYPRDAFQRARFHSLFLKTEGGKHEFSFEIEILLHYLSIPKKSIQIDENSLVLPTEGGEIRLPVLGEENQIPVYIPNQPLTKSYQPSKTPFQMVSFVDVLEKKLDPGTFKDKLVLIGATTDVSQHTYVTAMNLTMPRILISAHQIGNMLRQKIIIKNPWFSDAFLLLIALVIALICSTLVSPSIHSLIIFVLYGSFTVLDLYLFQTNLIDTNMIAGALMNLIILVSVTAARYFAERAEKAEIRYAFSHYVTASVVNEILKDTSMLKLGGERRQLTVFFSDIEGFTTISETLEIERLVNLLNEYLTAMTDNIIFDHGGMLDKYEGDAIMAIFGAPVHVKDHSYDACMAALDNQRILKESLWKKWKVEKNPLFRVRIGINTGTMLVGNMGSRSRFDYTVVGDNVNIGSRLEDLNKFYGTDILVSEGTRLMVKDRLLFRLIDMVQVKGKSIPLEVYELLGPNEKVPDRIKKLSEMYSRAFQSYQTRDFFKASKEFEEAYQFSECSDHASLLLRDRCSLFQKNSPAEEWDGSYSHFSSDSAPSLTIPPNTQN